MVKFPERDAGITAPNLYAAFGRTRYTAPSGFPRMRALASGIPL